jgi:uncharacterized membrane protein
MTKSGAFQRSRLELWASISFGIALVGFGVLGWIHGDVIIGRAPAWPLGWPGQSPAANVSGVWLVIVGLSLIVRRRWKAGLLTTVAVLAAWALSRNLIVLASDPNAVVVTFAGKALALAGGVFLFARPLNRGAVLVAGVSLGAFLVLGGGMHFVYPAFVASLIPAWIPGPMFWTYVAGVALIAGGLSMQFPRTRSGASMLAGLMILTWVFMLHLPRALAAATDAAWINEWTAVFEALAFSATAFGVAASVSGSDSER